MRSKRNCAGCAVVKLAQMSVTCTTATGEERPTGVRLTRQAERRTAVTVIVRGRRLRRYMPRCAAERRQQLFNRRKRCNQAVALVGREKCHLTNWQRFDQLHSAFACNIG